MWRKGQDSFSLTVRDCTSQEKSQVAPLAKDAAVHCRVFGHWLQLHMLLASLSSLEEMAQGKMEASAYFSSFLTWLFKIAPFKKCL